MISFAISSCDAFSLMLWSAAVYHIVSWLEVIDRVGVRTEWNVVVDIQRDLLSRFDFIHALQDGQAVANTVDAHFLQLVVLQRDQRLADNTILCRPYQQKLQVL